MVGTEFDLLGELEEELEEEEAELEPLLPRRGGIAHRFGEKQRGQAVTCPGPARAIVSRFPRYSNSVTSLPLNEQTKVKDIATLIVRSFQPGCQPIRTIRLVGHADMDLQRERREPGFMTKISRARALGVRQALERLINNRAISSPIAWDVSGMGATSLVVPNPRTEPERARNRRVEIWLNGTEPSSPDYIRWVQRCLNQVLSIRLAVTGVMEPRTRTAIRAFQQRQGLAINGILNPQTLAAFINACGFPNISPAAGWADAATSGAATNEPNISVPSIGWNKALVRLSRIDRVPLDSLTTANPVNDRDAGTPESAVQRAIMLTPYYLDQQNTQIDVLLHLHGFNIGLRQRASGGSGCNLLKGSVRDIDCDRMEQQLEAWGFAGGCASLQSRGERLIAVAAQGTNRSNFGTGQEGMFLDPNAYLKEIFQRLNALGKLPQIVQPDGTIAPPNRTILSGHSGAGGPLSKMLDSGNVPSNLGMVLLFDAINGPNELMRVTKWVLAQISNDINNLKGKATETEQLDYLSHSMRFFGFSTNNGYKARYQELDRSIKAFITKMAKVPPLASDRVVRMLNDNSKPNSMQGNYQVIFVGHGDHNGIIGKPAPGLQGVRPLEVALARFPCP